MSISNEDKKDVAKHLGKALANKVSKVTRDKNHPQAYSINGREVNKSQWDMWHHQKAIADRNKANNYWMAADKAKNARKELFKSGVKNVGKDRAIELSKKAFGSRKTRAGMSKEAMSAIEKGDKGAFIRSFMK